MCNLKLTKSFFTKLNVEVNTSYEPIQVTDLSINVQYKVELFRHNHDEKKYQIIFKIIGLDADQALPYTINIEMIGLFEVTPSFIKDKPRIIEVNGASILYSSIREQVLTLTGRSAWGTFNLPTLDLHAQLLNSPEAKSNT